MRSYNSWLVSLFWFLLAVASAFALRAFWIDHPALWTDEVFTIVYARHDLPYLLSLTRTSDIHPPLYYIAVKGAVELFGEGDGTRLRLLSVAASALAAGLLILFGRQRFGIGVAVVTTVFFVLLPVNVHYGRELRTYSFLALALLSAILCFLLMLEENRGARWRSVFAAGYAASLVAAFHLHYSAAVYFFLFGVAILALWIAKPKAINTRYALVITAIAGLLCLPQAFHFLWARSRVDGDFWIANTSWANFYSITLGAYPFPSWGKLITYPLYVIGAWLLWRKDRSFAIVAIIFVVGGPLTVAVIGLFTPAYLVRSIQAFTILSPFLLAFAILALPRVAAWAGVAVLLAIHILSIRHDFPAQKEDLAIDLIHPTLQREPSEVVYYVSFLGLEVDLRNLATESWVPVALDDAGALDTIRARLEGCAGLGTCGSAAVVMERAPRFQVEDGRRWMTGLDKIADEFGTKVDRDIAGFRVMVIPAPAGPRPE